MKKSYMVLGVVFLVVGMRAMQEGEFLQQSPTSPVSPAEARMRAREEARQLRMQSSGHAKRRLVFDSDLDKSIKQASEYGLDENIVQAIQNNAIAQQEKIAFLKSLNPLRVRVLNKIYEYRGAGGIYFFPEESDTYKRFPHFVKVIAKSLLGSENPSESTLSSFELESSANRWVPIDRGQRYSSFRKRSRSEEAEYSSDDSSQEPAGLFYMSSEDADK